MKKLLLILLATLSLSATITEGSSYTCSTTLEDSTESFAITLTMVGQTTMLIEEDIILTYNKNAKRYIGKGSNGYPIILSLYPEDMKFTLASFTEVFTCKEN